MTIRHSNPESNVSLLFNVKGSSPIASLTTTIAAGAEGRFAVSDCDGHKRIESTHLENHFDQVCQHIRIDNESQN